MLLLRSNRKMPSSTGTYIISDTPAQHVDWPVRSSYVLLLESWMENQGFSLKARDNFASPASLSFNSPKKIISHNIVSQLKSSKQCVLILTKNTKKLTGIIPFELTYAIDECKLPLIIMYPDYESITSPQKLSMYWPKELKSRIENRQVKAIHIPFLRLPARDALRRFHLNGKQCLPNGYGHFNTKAYQDWGLQSSLTSNTSISQAMRSQPLIVKFAR